MFPQDEDNLVGRPPQGREAEVQRRPQVLRHPVLRPAAGEVDHLLRWHPAEAGHWNQGVRDWLPGKGGLEKELSSVVSAMCWSSLNDGVAISQWPIL